MAKTINPIDVATETFQNWITRTNDIIAAVNNEVVTANSSAGVTTGNAYVVGIISAATALAANTIRGGNVTSTATLTIASNVSLGNTTNILVGNATVNTTISTGLVSVVNSSGTVNVSPVDVKAGNTVVNSTAVAVGANSFINSTYVSSNNVYGDSLVANVASVATLSANALAANTISGGNSSVTAALNIATNVAMPNTTNLLVGNSTVNSVVNSGLVKVANSTGSVNISAVDVKTGISVVNSTVIAVGANSFVNATHVSSNNIASDSINATVIQSGISKVNATTVSVGANSVINATHVVANNINGDLATITTVQTGISKVNSTTVSVGSNSVINATHVSSNNVATDVGVANSFTANTIKGGNSTVTSALNISSNVSMPNTTSVLVGNTTFNTVITSTLIRIANSFSSVNVTALDVTAGLSKMNTTVVAVGSNTYMNATHVVANTISADVISATTFNYSNSTVTDIISVSNASFTANLIPTGLVTANVIVGANNILVGTNVSINTTAMIIGANATINTTAYKINDTVVNNAGVYLTSGSTSTINVQTSGTSAQVVDSATLASTRTLEYVWSIADNNANGYQTSKLSIVHAGGASYHTEYGVVFSNTQLGVFSTDTNTTHVRVLFTPTVANAQLKAVRTAVNV